MIHSSINSPFSLATVIPHSAIDNKTGAKRFDIYSDNGTFPTLEDFNQQKSLLTGLDWYYEGDKVIVDLNFGNLSKLTPQFVCDNYVIKWLNDEGEIHSTYFREDYDYSSCNQIE